MSIIRTLKFNALHGKPAFSRPCHLHKHYRLPAIRCEFGAMNAKYQMHLRLRELANPSNPPLYPPMLINVNTLNLSAQRFSDYLKTEVIKSYIDVCIMNDCYVCDNSN